MVPIWKDYIVRINHSFVYFRVYLDSAESTLIYEGKAVARPGDEFVDIRMNDICSSYLKHNELNFDQSINESRISRTFVLRYATFVTDVWWYTAATVEFQNDWSYDYSYLFSRDGLLFPISLAASNSQRLIMSVPLSPSVSAALRFIDGSVLSMSVPIYRTADFNNDFNNDYSHTNDAKPGVAMLDLAALPGLASVTMGGKTWTIETSVCHRYALYYINAYGGWDTLLCRGNGVEADEWDRKTYTIAYDNRQKQARGVVDYVNEQKKRWMLRTGWLTDEGASRMHHLLGSTMVYLHDLQEDAILPVGITTTDAPYKTYMNEGARLVNYEFQVELQQERVRR